MTDEEQRQKNPNKILLHGQNRNYFLVSKITPRQTANTRPEQSYYGISLQSMNTFIFTGLGTFTHIKTHLKRCMFCLLSPTESPVGKQIILRFLQEQYIRADFFFILNLSNLSLRLKDTFRQWPAGMPVVKHIPWASVELGFLCVHTYNSWDVLSTVSVTRQMDNLKYKPTLCSVYSIYWLLEAVPCN